MKRNRYVKRVLSTLLIVILCFSVISMAFSAILFRVIFPRCDEAQPFEMCYTDLDARAYPRERMTFLSGGNRLTGYLYNCASPHALVVIAAGFGSGSCAHLTQVQSFIDCGYDVFCYDATGVGESEGSGTVGLSQPGLDLRAALDCICSDERLSRLPILLYAHSAGGYGAAVCCGDYPQVKAAAILCGFSSPLSMMYSSARERVGFLADIEYPFLALQNSLTFGASADESAVSRLKDCAIPVLVLEGENDSRVPVSLRLSSYREEIANPLVTYRIVSDDLRSGHSDLWLCEEASLYRAVCSCAHLTPDPITANRADDSFMQDVIGFYESALSS